MENEKLENAVLQLVLEAKNALLSGDASIRDIAELLSDALADAADCIECPSEDSELENPTPKNAVRLSAHIGMMGFADALENLISKKRI